jgi:hypothetical protein
MSLWGRLFRRAASPANSAISPLSRRSNAEARTVIVRGAWMRALWTDAPVALPQRPVLPDFLLQTPMPPLLRLDDYVRAYPDDRQRVLHWVVALLHHPDPAVVLDVFRFWEAHWSEYVSSEIRMPYRLLMFDSAADHLVSPREELRAAAAAFMWRGYSADNFRNLMAIIEDPAYPDPRGAVETLERYAPSTLLNVLSPIN